MRSAVPVLFLFAIGGAGCQFVVEGLPNVGDGTTPMDGGPSEAGTPPASTRPDGAVGPVVPPEEPRDPQEPRDPTEPPAEPMLPPAILMGELLQAPQTLDLSAEGARDWAVWGPSGTDAVRKTGGDVIGDHRGIRASLQGAESGYPTTFSWSDGTPTQSGTSTGSIAITGRDSAILLSVKADPAAVTTLRLYVSAFGAVGRLEARLDDDSAPRWRSPRLEASRGNVTAGVMEVRFQPRAATRLIVVWTVESASRGGAVGLSAATVK